MLEKKYYLKLFKRLMLYLKAKFHSTLEQSILWITYITIELYGYGSSFKRYTIVLQLYCLTNIMLTFSLLKSEKGG